MNHYYTYEIVNLRTMKTVQCGSLDAESMDEAHALAMKNGQVTIEKTQEEDYHWPMYDYKRQGEKVSIHIKKPASVMYHDLHK